jgi:hypothetical protein
MMGYSTTTSSTSPEVIAKGGLHMLLLSGLLHLQLLIGTASKMQLLHIRKHKAADCHGLY